MTRKTLYAACLTLAPLAAVGAAAPSSQAAQFTPLYKFTSSNRLEGVEGTLAVLDNVLFGATEEGGSGGASDGTVFMFDLGTLKETTLVNFTGLARPTKGQAPTGPLSVVGTSIYGSTVVGNRADRNDYLGAGEIWTLNGRNGKERVFHAFDDKDGAQPLSGVTPVKGVLYGVTRIGGPNNTGTVFTLDATGMLTQLYAFPDATIGCNPSAGVIAVGKILYGTTSSCGAGQGTVFSPNLATGRASVLHIFQPGNQTVDNPNALVVRDGALYGTTLGDGGAGTVYKIDLHTNQYTLLHAFGAAGDGAGPTSGLTSFNGMFYGVTQGGGASGGGTIYRIDPATGSEAVAHSFTGRRDGDSPDAGLLAYQGALYGSTLNTNSDNQGTIFKFVP